VAVESVHFDAELPSALGFDVRHTDREVILVRSELKAASVLSNFQAGTFVHNRTIVNPLVGTITFRRGWVALDIKVQQKSLRFISTHLDLESPESKVQQAQASELLDGPALTPLPVILVGDLNSPGDGSGETYNSLITVGFGDAAVQAGIGDEPTCCQAPDR
jgi:endonuclease/exonuclease/phosphatase family metal-dependent hydrolase